LLTLPSEIPEELRADAVFVEGPGFSEMAWPREEALAVIESLMGTLVAVSGGDVYRSEAWGFVPAYEYWLCDRIQGEDSVNYAQRSRATAKRFVESHGGERPESVLFALAFDTQQEAA